MPISADDLAEVTKTSLDEYLRNVPVDQIAHERPLLRKMMSKKKKFGGARQGVVENVRKGYDDNMQWAYGDTAVQFNKRNSTEPVQFDWRRATSGLYLEHDRLFANGIKVVEGGKRGEYRLEQNEKVQLVNLLQEQQTILKEGFEESLDRHLHRNGTQSPDAPVGLDLLVSTTPAVGTVGGLNAATTTWWRNHANLAAGTGSALLDAMEAAWRQCFKNGGSPDFILAGGNFIDAYRKAITITQNADVGQYKRVDAGVGAGSSTGLYFKGIEIVWDPTFEALQTIETAATNWNDRCYFLNTKHLGYRDDDMQVVNPTRPHNILAEYFMVNLRCLMTTNRRNAHAVLALTTTPVGG